MIVNHGRTCFHTGQRLLHDLIIAIGHIGIHGLGRLAINRSFDNKGNTGLFKQASEELKIAMEKYGKTTKGWLFDKTLRYEETFLTEGDELYVLGEVVRKKNGSPVFEKGKKPFLISAAVRWSSAMTGGFWTVSPPISSPLKEIAV